MDTNAILGQAQPQNVSDGKVGPLLNTEESGAYQLILVWPQLGDFDSLEYAWWIQRQAGQLSTQGVQVRAVGIGNRESGQRFCDFTGFPAKDLYVDPKGDLHRQLNLYPGLTWTVPFFTPVQNSYLNLLLMCAGIGSPGTLTEVFRGYKGDRNAPQLIADEETVQAFPLPPVTGALFNRAGGKGFQRPFELATLRLRNMAEVLKHWQTYVPDATYLTQRGGTFLFDDRGELVYEHRDRNILGFAANMSNPLSFLQEFRD